MPHPQRNGGRGCCSALCSPNLQLLYSSLHVEPDGSPAALLLTEECSRAVCAVQLLPPFVWEDPLPPLPDVPAALTLQLTLQDVEAIDTDPAALARRLCQTTRQKHWLAHPPKQICILRRKLPFSKGFIVNAIIRALHPYMG